MIVPEPFSTVVAPNESNRRSQVSNRFACISAAVLRFLRPVAGWASYRTPVENLYLCGASCHPGPGVTGVPGYNGAQEVLKTWRG